MLVVPVPAIQTGLVVAEVVVLVEVPRIDVDTKVIVVWEVDSDGAEDVALSGVPETALPVPSDDCRAVVL